MYCEHFGFKERPFTIAPNPKYLFMSELHREALAHLVFGIGDSGGFVLLTGEVGTGKTTVCRCLLEQLPENTDIAFILNPRLSAIELLESICDDLDLTFMQDDVTLKHLNDVLNAHLLRSHSNGRQTILLIDEAQNLDPDVLEQVRLLTNLETNETKLLQIILIGQPELKDMLEKAELRQLSQRITARYHLAPLSLQDTSGYIHYRVAVAGSDDRFFSEQAIHAIHRISQGVPRLINTICDRALLGAYAKGSRKIDPGLVKQAAIEVLGSKGPADSGKVHKSDNESFFSMQAVFKQAAFASAILAVGIFLGWIFSGAEKPVVENLALSSGVKSQQQTQLQDNNFQASQVPVQQESIAQNSIAQNSIAIAQQETQEVSNTSGETSPSSSSEALSDPQTSGFSQEDRLLAYVLDYENAFSQLANIWSRENITGCEQLINTGLSCENLQGTWWQIIEMDRPVLLRLNIRGVHQYMTVVGMDPERLAVLKQDELFWLAKAQIEPLWTGEFLMLWNPPVNFTRPIKMGDSGTVVQWLEQKLLLITEPDFGADSIVPSTIRFDSAMKQQLKSFQSQYGLEPDGVAGLKTLMRINQLTGMELPRLENLSNLSEKKNVTHP